MYCCFSCGTGTLFFLVYQLVMASCVFLNTLPLMFSHLMWKMLENVVKCMCRPENSAIQNWSVIMIVEGWPCAGPCWRKRKALWRPACSACRQNNKRSVLCCRSPVPASPLTPAQKCSWKLFWGVFFRCYTRIPAKRSCQNGTCTLLGY